MPAAVVPAAVEREWAAVVFWHSLEHLPSAGEDLDRAVAGLRPRGVLVIAMPNADSLQARAFGDRWLALDLPRHLVHVPAAALLDRLRVAARDRRNAAGAARPVRGDPPSRGALGVARARAAGGDSDLGYSARAPRRARGAGRDRGASRGDDLR